MFRRESNPKTRMLKKEKGKKSAYIVFVHISKIFRMEQHQLTEYTAFNGIPKYLINQPHATPCFPHINGLGYQGMMSPTLKKSYCHEVHCMYRKITHVWKMSKMHNERWDSRPLHNFFPNPSTPCLYAPMRACWLFSPGLLNIDSPASNPWPEFEISQV